MQHKHHSVERVSYKLNFFFLRKAFLGLVSKRSIFDFIRIVMWFEVPIPSLRSNQENEDHGRKFDLSKRRSRHVGTRSLNLLSSHTCYICKQDFEPLQNVDEKLCHPSCLRQQLHFESADNSKYRTRILTGS